MAVYYFRNTGDANWGTATNWSLSDGGPADGAVPTSTDDAYFTTNSGNCTINAVVRECFRLVTTGYTGTITTTNNLNVLSDCTLSSGTTMSGASNVVFATTTTATLTMNGASVTGVNEIRFFGSVTYTLADTWTVSNVRFPNNNTVLNSGTLNVTGNLTVAAQPAAGTTQINLTGTGTWSGNNAVQNPLTINTSGTITLSDTVQVNGGGTRSFTYTSGTIITTGSTLILNSITLVGNWSSINFNNLTIAGAGTTTTLSSDLNVLGTFGFIGTSTVTLNGVYNINVSGSLTHSSSGVLGGQPTIILNGTGTWSNTSTGSLRLNVNINTAGTITLGTNVRYNTGTLTYIAGTIINTGSTLTIAASTTFDTSGMTWNNVSMSGTFTITNTTPLVVGGTLTLDNTSVATNAIHCQGNLTIGNNTGTSGTIIINGTGNQTWNTGGQLLRLNLQINKPSGTLTLGANVQYSTNTITYIAGTIDATTNNSTLVINGIATFNTSGMTWNNVTLGGGTSTLSSDLNIGGNLLINGTLTLTGVGRTVFVGGSLTNSSANNTTGTASIVLNGTGTWNHSSTGTISNNLTINTSGTITVATVRWGGGTFTYSAGTVNFTNTFTTNGTSTFNNVSTLNFNNLTLSTGGAATYTFNSVAYCNQLLIGGNTSTTQTVNGSNIYIRDLFTNGNTNLTTTNTGTATLYFNSTGTTTINQSVTSTSTCNLNMVINKPSGILYIGSNGLNFRYGTRTIQWISGTVDVVTPIYITANMTFDTSSSYWSGVIIPGTNTITLNSDLNVGTLTLGQTGNVTFTTTGTTGFMADTLTITGGRTITLKDSAYYASNNITKNVTTSAITITSSSGTLKSYLNYYNTEPIGRFNGTRIDSSGGSTIYTNVNTTLTETINWGKMEGTSWWIFLKK